MKICRYFSLEDFIPKEIYLIEDSKSLLRIDNRLIAIADGLRDIFGALTVNTWLSGGDRNYSGFRPDPLLCLDKTLAYKNTSQHCAGRAGDFHSKTMTGPEMRLYIKRNPHKFPLIRGIENNVSWLHIDCGNRPGNEIVFF